jgi:prepilin-type N-terminal cleavage/methylation domain-containing protein
MKHKRGLSRVTSRGFTLIELLVVISILGVLAALIVNNLNDSRARARDARAKQNLNQMKTALRLYYNDYQVYPASSGFGCGTGKMNYILGCGDNGDECCPCDSSLDFAAGSACNTVYMTSFPDGFGDNTISYYSDNSEVYCLKTSLENASDPDIQTSIDQCLDACDTAGAGTITSPTYAVCTN